MLRVDGLHVWFGSTHAVDDVSFEVGQGQTMALLGPSGSGKSTVLRTIAGLQTPAAGAIVLDGADVGHLPAHRRAVGLTFQDHALFPHRDVGANVAFGLRMRGDDVADIEARVAEVLALTGLSGFERRRVQSLSGGEQQRVALARALAPAPRVLLLDEPLGSLDRTLRERLVRELRDLFADLGITVVIVTHDQDEAFALADQVAVLRRGRVVQQGPPRQLWRAPGDLFVARFLGFTNCVDVVVVDEVATTPWGTVAAPRIADGPAHLVFRPDSLRSGEGPVTGIAEQLTFRGDHFLVGIRTDAGPRLDALVPASMVPDPGAKVAFTIERAGVVLFPAGEPDLH